MQLGMVGLGRMGANMVRRLMRDGHECHGFDVDAEAVGIIAAEGGVGSDSLTALVAALSTPRHVWLMVPAALVDSTIDQIVPLLDEGDTLIDGGNSWYRDDVDRAGRIAASGIHYLDVGTSGGTHGLERGYCLMVGGSAEAVAQMTPIFTSLAPGVEAAPRTPGRTGEPTPDEHGWLHCGPSGAGHFVKMVHNGIEYGLMAAFAEGLNLLAHADAGTERRTKDAETAPLSHPQYYQYEFDLEAITEVWRRGSVISGFLLDVTAMAFTADPQLSEFTGRVSDSGEGRWTIQAAVDTAVPVPVLSTALFQRFSSRDQDEMANKAQSAMRAWFGGHHERQVGQ